MTLLDTRLLTPLSLRRTGGFTISFLHAIHFGHCSDELAHTVFTHSTWLGHVPHVRHTFAHTLLCGTLHMRELIGSVMVSSLLLPTLWNSLPSFVFLASFNLPSFKRQVYHTHFGARWHDFFIFLFFITLFRCSLLHSF